MKNGVVLFYAITADNAGNIYYAGYHFATESDATTNIDEPDMDVFICPNYGEGTWRRIPDYSKFPMWNPDSSPTDTTGYFDSPVSGAPYGDTENYISHLLLAIQVILMLHLIIWEEFMYLAFGLCRTLMDTIIPK